MTPAQPMPGPPKKTDDKSFFDVSILLFFYFFKYILKFIIIYTHIHTRV